MKVISNLCIYSRSTCALIQTISHPVNKYSTPPLSNPLPLLQPNHTLQRLPQKPLPRLQRLLIKIKIISPKSRANNKRQLHLRDISPHTASWSIAKRNKRILLTLSQIVPSIRHILVRIAAPNLLGVMDRVRWDGQNRIRREMLAQDIDALSRGHDAG